MVGGTETGGIPMGSASAPGVVGVARPGAEAAAITVREYRGDRIVFGLRHPQPVGGFHVDYPRNVGAAVGLVGRQPRCGVAIALLLVDRRGGGLQVDRVVGEVAASGRVPLLCALLPGVRQRNDVVDLHLRGRAVAALEVDGGVGVGVVQVPLSTAQPFEPGLISTATRSRRRMSLRVSQPLCPSATVTSSLHESPNRLRSYPVFGARPLIGRLASVANAAVDCASAWAGVAGRHLPPGLLWSRRCIWLEAHHAPAVAVTGAWVDVILLEQAGDTQRVTLARAP